jgi:CelD/BcsL family acetyltransferase involved in cellulose biosynthesis
VQAAAPAWQALVHEDTEATMFQSPQMCAAWHARPVSGERLFLLLAWQGDRPVGLWPLLMRQAQKHGLRLRVLASASPRADLLAVGDRRAVTVALVTWLLAQTRRWDVIELEDLRPATACDLAATFGAARSTDLDGPVAAPSEAFIDTRPGWPAYLAARGQHFRHRLKPQTRKIERLGQVSLRRFEGGDAAVGYEEFLRLEPRSWKARVEDTCLPPRERDAFRALIQSDGEVRPDLLFLDVDGKPAAAMLSLAYRRVYYLFVTYFDDALRAWYPGRRLFLESLQHAYANPHWEEVSFVGAYPFARAWCDGLREYRSLKVWGGGWRARLARLLAPRLTPADAAVDEASPDGTKGAHV